MALFPTNAFGVPDAINAAGKAIVDAVPILHHYLAVFQAWWKWSSLKQAPKLPYHRKGHTDLCRNESRPASTHEFLKGLNMTKKEDVIKIHRGKVLDLRSKGYSQAEVARDWDVQNLPFRVMFKTWKTKRQSPLKTISPKFPSSGSAA